MANLGAWRTNGLPGLGDRSHPVWRQTQLPEGPLVSLHSPEVLVDSPASLKGKARTAGLIQCFPLWVKDRVRGLQAGSMYVSGRPGQGPSTANPFLPSGNGGRSSCPAMARRREKTSKRANCQRSLGLFTLVMKLIGSPASGTFLGSLDALQVYWYFQKCQHV